MITVGPLWFLNLTLIILNIVLFVFLGITYDKVEINFAFNNKTDKEETLTKSDIPSLENITERDIFNTQSPIKKSKTVYSYKSKNIVNVFYPPEFPQSLPIQIPLASEKEILPPLQISLNGTIINDNPIKNIVFIENMKTKEEKEYSIGDIVEDGQIVFINKNKVIFVRSNGQEESIYLNKLFKIDEEANFNTPWTKIIYLKEDNIRYIDLNLFKYKIKSLATFIEEIGLETYFEKNIPIGCKVKNAKEGTLANLLGLCNDDLIIAINNIPINTNSLRMKCLNIITENIYNSDFILDVELKRNNINMHMYFKCFENEKKDILKNIGLFKVSEQKSSEYIGENKE